MINILAAYKRTVYDLKDFTDIICIDLIHLLYTDVLDIMLEEVSNLRNVQVSEETINRFVDQLQKDSATV